MLFKDNSDPLADIKKAIMQYEAGRAYGAAVPGADPFQFKRLTEELEKLMYKTFGADPFKAYPNDPFKPAYNTDPSKAYSADPFRPHTTDPFVLMQLKKTADDLEKAVRGKVEWWTPDADIKETDKETLILLDLAGVKKDEVTLHLDGQKLLVAGAKPNKVELDDKVDKKDGEKNGKDAAKDAAKDDKLSALNVKLWKERKNGPFSRTFVLAAPAKESDIKANFKDGVLEIVISKQAELEAKKKIAIV